MTIEIHIEYGSIIKRHVLYDGPKDERHRSERETLAEILDLIQKSHDVKGKYEIYFDGYTPDEKRSMELVIQKQFPRAKFPKK